RPALGGDRLIGGEGGGIRGTMSTKRTRWGWRKLARLGSIAAVLAVALIAAGLGLAQVPQLVWIKVALGFLISLETIYGVALALGSIGVAVLATLLIRGRRRGRPHPAVSRWLLLCLSLLLGLALCEGTSAALRARSRRTTAMPAGGF